MRARRSPKLQCWLRKSRGHHNTSRCCCRLLVRSYCCSRPRRRSTATTTSTSRVATCCCWHHRRDRGRCCIYWYGWCFAQTSRQSVLDPSARAWSPTRATAAGRYRGSRGPSRRLGAATPRTELLPPRWSCYGLYGLILGVGLALRVWFPARLVPPRPRPGPLRPQPLHSRHRPRDRRLVHPVPPQPRPRTARPARPDVGHRARQPPSAAGTSGRHPAARDRVLGRHRRQRGARGARTRHPRVACSSRSRSTRS